MPSVIFEREKNALKISLNRVSVLNAVNRTVLEELQRGLIEAATDPDIAALMVFGRGACFSAGADIKELAQLDRAGLRKFHRLREETFALLETFPGPTFAAIERYALGTGLELALCCDFRIADEHARLGIPSAKLGIVESYEYLTRLVRAVGTFQTKKMIFSGESIEARAAYAIGMVEEVVPAGGLFERADALCNAFSKNAAGAIRGSKVIVDTCGRDPYLQTVEDTALPMVDSFTSAECQDRLTAFLTKRSDG
jgi:enoyl-CoA hydratase/carnithine racemase